MGGEEHLIWLDSSYHATLKGTALIHLPMRDCHPCGAMFLKISVCFLTTAWWGRGEYVGGFTYPHKQMYHYISVTWEKKKIPSAKFPTCAGLTEPGSLFLFPFKEEPRHASPSTLTLTEGIYVGSRNPQVSLLDPTPSPNAHPALLPAPCLSH